MNRSQKTIVTLDVREQLANDDEPFSEIMGAVNTLQDHQTLALHTPFQPLPLFRVLEKRGFAYESWEETEGHWISHFWKDVSRNGTNDEIG